MTNNSAPSTLPGRLGTPGMLLRDDPRVDPRIPAALAPFELDGEAAPAPFGLDAPLEDRIAFASEAEPGFEGLFAALMTSVPAPEGVEDSTETITGVDGNEIDLFIHRPAGVTDPLPGLLHIHGGGMAILSAAGPLYERWRQKLAATGMVVVGVQFRNAAGALGPHAFPAGLNDCTSALQWMHDNRESLGISKLVVSGESGGGNLTLATTLKAKADGRLDQIDGVYAMCPYISNDYLEKATGLLSLTENDTYFLNGHMMGVLSSVYDGADSTDPLAWPYFASEEDVTGLPPHVISVNELDPLRDEGLSYYHKLVKAGVRAVGRTVNGTTHAGDAIFQAAIPEVTATTINDIYSFAASL
ncbi:MAG: alpha/beta hydrolase fold domain-containing protein [Chloroflexota bacterium]